MVAPAFRAAATAAVDDATSIAVAVPTGTAEGDLLVAAISTAPNTTWTDPAGWTLLLGPVMPPSSNTVSTRVYYRIAGASEPASYTWGFGGSVYASASMAAYSGAHNTDPFNDHNSAGYDSVSDIICPSVTTTYPDTLLVAVYTQYHFSTSPTYEPPTGFTERAEIHATRLGHAIADVAQAGTGGSGDKTATSTRADKSTGVLLALRPYNTPPNAPILTNPVGGATFDRTAAQRFAWDFSDPDQPGDSQSQYELRYRLVGAGTWTTVGPNATPNTFHDFAAGTFAAGDYEWQARTWDEQGEVGPWSASEFFTAATPPDPPSITDPISGQTIPTETYTVEWSAPNQAAYQLRRVADNAGSPDTATVYFDTGTVESSTARSRPVDFPVNNRWEHVQVRIRNDGLWSEWASVRVEVSWTSPPAPSVTAVGNDTGGYIAVAVDNPAPVGDEPSVTSNDLYRREVGDTGPGIRIARDIAPDGTYNDYATASRQAVEYRARALGSNGTSSLSAWAG